MGDLLDSGLGWLGEKRSAHMARSVLYSRGEDSVELLATPGRSVFEQVADFGIQQRHEVRDFLVIAADLVLDGSTVEPAEGDEIRDTVGASVLVYMVQAPGVAGSSEPAFRYSDPYRRTLRIHTRHTATEDVEE